MAFCRACYLAVLLFCVSISNSTAQVIYYPVNSSQLLKATALDVAELLIRAGANSTSQINVQEYSGTLPVSGIVLVYDSTITDNQLCRLQGTETRLVFTAAEDNGLVFGIYQYLGDLGYKFYQPGTIWEVIPRIPSVFKQINKDYTTAFKYKSWFISGGHRNWIMDKNTGYNWELYTGENGHNWALYQRRNGMLGGYGFGGHRGDIINGTYMQTIQQNPCYVASFNGSRQATTASVPDIFNTEAKALWANTIEQKYKQKVDNILNNRVLYVNLYRNLKFGNRYLGIEVPDGARWGNSTDGSGCNSLGYSSESDQSITLANYTANKIKARYPSQRFHIYGYFSHANVPSTSLKIDTSLDIQVVSTAFQSESSSKGLLNRWYNRHAYISEYHYLNIPQWSGETPLFYIADLRQTLQRLKEKNSQGITWETSAAKFGSLPYLKAANETLVSGKSFDSGLRSFCEDMFEQASEPVFQLLQLWASDETVTMGYFTRDNKYKIPAYYELLKKANDLVPASNPVLKQRMLELKAYLHYMKLYYDWLSDPREVILKEEKARSLCIYLARINKLQVVNSYYLITGIVYQFGTGSSFYAAYNVLDGTSYQGGNIPLISAGEIDADYTADLSSITNTNCHYEFLPAVKVAEVIETTNLVPAANIKVNIGYTNGANYSNRSEFNIQANSAGTFSMQFSTSFGMPGQGYINFTLEDENKALGILKDTSLGISIQSGRLDFQLPGPGLYKLSVVSKYKSSVLLDITTNGNRFYKNTAFTHRYAEKYNAYPQSLPGYFYVPKGLERVYFSVNNGYSAAEGYLSPAAISSEFAIKDMYGNAVPVLQAAGNDKALFYIEIPAGQSGNFWQLSKMGQYFFSFANISNNLWYGSRKSCSLVNIKVTVTRTGDECFTRLSVNQPSAGLKWEINDRGNLLHYSSLNEVILPAGVSPEALVTVVFPGNCSVSKRLSQDPDYLRQLESCASGAPVLPFDLPAEPFFFPIPSKDRFTVRMPSPGQVPRSIIVSDAAGRKIVVYSNVTTIDLGRFAAGNYYYQLFAGDKIYRGKLVKL